MSSSKQAVPPGPWAGWRGLGVAAGVLAAAPVLLVSSSILLQAGKILYARWVYRTIPGDAPHPLLGHIPKFIAMGGSNLYVQDCKKRHGPIFKIFILSKVFVVICDADEAHTQLFRWGNHAMFVNPSIRAMQGKNLLLDEQGLVQARGDFWRMLRNAWQPAFAPGTLTRYQTIMEKCAVQLASILGKQAAAGKQATAGATTTNGADSGAGAYVDIHHLLNAMTLDVVGGCAYGVEFHALSGDAAPPSAPGPALAQACKDFFFTSTTQNGSKWGLAIALLPTAAPFLVPLAHRFPDKPLQRISGSRTTILNTSNALIADWRAANPVEEQGPDAIAAASKAGKGGLSGIEPGSFLGLMLEAQARAVRASLKAANPQAVPAMTDTTIAAQTNTFILAGTETTANTLSFAVYLVEQHPEVEKLIVKEVVAHGPPGTPLDKEKDKFPYVDAVISETMRLFPAAHATSRDVDSPGGAKVAGHHVPDKTSLFISSFVMHQDPQYWPRASEFLPERWLPERQAELGPTTPNAYMPFGGGTRACPGHRFALMEARMAMVTLYKSFTFELEPGQVPLKCTAGITLSPRNGVRVRCVPRTWPPGKVEEVVAVSSSA